MIQHLASGIHPAKPAPMPVGSGRRKPPIHGRQDKSADRGRAHVVGGIEVSANPSRRDAGARARKASDINGPSAISPINAKGRRP